MIEKIYFWKYIFFVDWEIYGSFFCWLRNLWFVFCWSTKLGVSVLCQPVAEVVCLLETPLDGWDGLHEPPNAFICHVSEACWLSGVLISCCIFTNGHRSNLVISHAICSYSSCTQAVNFFMYCAATLGLTHRTLSVPLGSILLAMMICRYTWTKSGKHVGPQCFLLVSGLGVIVVGSCARNSWWEAALGAQSVSFEDYDAGGRACDSSFTQLRVVHLIIWLGLQQWPSRCSQCRASQACSHCVWMSMVSLNRWRILAN